MEEETVGADHPAALVFVIVNVVEGIEDNRHLGEEKHLFHRDRCADAKRGLVIGHSGFGCAFGT